LGSVPLIDRLKQPSTWPVDGFSEVRSDAVLSEDPLVVLNVPPTSRCAPLVISTALTSASAL